MNPINIFIPAAGLGERLRPITNHIPKPLIPVLGKPVLESVLERVSALPIHKIGINLHHESNMIENWLKQSAFSTMVEFFPEDPILGTGGALKNAGGFLRKSAFLVHNSDIISDIDLEKLFDFHLSSKNLVTLAVHDYQEFNKLVLDENGFLKEIVRNHPHPNPPFSKGREVGENAPPSPGGRGLGRWGKFLAFTGIAVYSPEFLKFLPQGASSVVDAWLKAVQHGYKIGTLDVTGCYWSDIGTPVSYVKAVINELRKNAEMVWIHPSVIGCKNIEMDGYVVIEEVSNAPSPLFSKRGKGGFFGANIPHKVISLRNCIMLPGTKIDMQEDTPPSPPLGKGGMEGVLYENCILGPGFRIDLSKSEMLGLSAETDSFLIGTGGSDRRYYRVKSKGRSAVLVQCHDKDPDFERHIEYTRFFKKYSIPVPELLDVNPDKKNASFEDLGDLSLYSWLKCPRDEGQIEGIYKEVLDILVTIHTVATKHVSECLYLTDRIFDYEHLRWETGYFMERFVEGVRNIKVNNLLTLNDEFHRLALKVDSFRKTVIHRDFQSQNIMITRGGIPRIVDYQGARIGPPAYDLVSILWDPYFRLEDDVRERLLNYYIDKVIPPLPPLVKGGNVNLNAKGDAASQNPPQSPFASALGRIRQGEKGGLRGITEKDFMETLLPCRLQRHMQALGAYGFLSKIKGKKYFMKYVPEGLRLLKEDVFLSSDEYSKLYDLTMRL